MTQIMKTSNQSTPMNYYSFSRKQWANFANKKNAGISEAALKRLAAVNDKIVPLDVTEIYQPLVALLLRNLTVHQMQQNQLAEFLHQPAKQVPFIIGITGSVAVGKSTTARLLQQLLSQQLPDKKVDLLTTDGFLYPNAVLNERQIMHRKGFPESYDMPRLLEFINTVKSGHKAHAPIYSHQTYDIIPDKSIIIDNPTILIIEGINVLQLPSDQPLYVSDFCDFTIYVDAAENLIERWYLQRFNTLLDTALKNPNNYYYKYTQGPRSEANALAKKVWQTVNRPNLEQYIRPTRERADLIVHKTTNHYVDYLALRKY